MVAGIEECSNSEFLAGPLGPLITGKKPDQVGKLVDMFNQSKKKVEA